jgi:micrococcal nuclease
MLNCFALALAIVALTANAATCGASRQAAQPPPGCVVGLVVDGDTFRCRDGRKVRLIGVDSPEQQQRPHGARSREALLNLLPVGAAVRLEHDVSPRDRYGRELAYVWAGRTLVNEAMVRDGWAVLYTVPPNVKYAGRLEQAQNKARARGAGLWADRGFDCRPVDYRRGRCISPP